MRSCCQTLTFTDELIEHPGELAQVPDGVGRTEAKTQVPGLLAECSCQHLPLKVYHPSHDLSNQSLHPTGLTITRKPGHLKPRMIQVQSIHLYSLQAENLLEKYPSYQSETLSPYPCSGRPPIWIAASG